MTPEHALLIADSLRSNRTTRAPYTDQIHEALLVECEDHQDEPGGWDARDEPVLARRYWGTDDHGREWSVKLTGAPGE